MVEVDQHRHGIPDIDAGACTHSRHLCPQHFTELSVNAMLAAISEDGGFIDVMNHLIDHGWASQAMATWGALLGFYGVKPDADVPADVLSLVPLPVAMELRRGTHPWYPIMTDFLSAALRRDGQGMRGVLTRFADAPDRARADMSGSVLLSAFRTVSGCPRATSTAVHLYHVFGSSVTTWEQFEALDRIVALADACACERCDVDDRIDAIGELQAEQLSAVTALALTAFGGMIDDPDYPVVMFRAAGVDVPDDDFLSHHMLSWRDTTLDAERDISELAACVAMRMATAQERGDSAGMRAAVEQTQQALPEDCRSVRTILVLACYGAANFIGVKVRGWPSTPWLGVERWDPGPDGG